MDGGGRVKSFLMLSLSVILDEATNQFQITQSCAKAGCRGSQLKCLSWRSAVSALVSSGSEQNHKDDFAILCRGFQH